MSMQTRINVDLRRGDFLRHVSPQLLNGRELSFQIQFLAVPRGLVSAWWTPERRAVVDELRRRLSTVSPSSISHLPSASQNYPQPD